MGNERPLPKERGGLCHGLVFGPELVLDAHIERVEKAVAESDLEKIRNPIVFYRFGVFFLIPIRQIGYALPHFDFGMGDGFRNFFPHRHRFFRTLV